MELPTSGNTCIISFVLALFGIGLARSVDAIPVSDGPITYDMLPHDSWTQEEFAFWNSGSIGTRPMEVALGVFFPWQIAGVMGAKNSADYLTELFYGGEAPDGTPGNAFNHACGSAIMSSRYGQDQALRWTYAHETYHDGFDFTVEERDGFTLAEHVNMDLHNDYYGSILPDLPDKATMSDEVERFLQGLDNPVTLQQACEEGNVSVKELWYAIQIKNQISGENSPYAYLREW